MKQKRLLQTVLVLLLFAVNTAVKAQSIVPEKSFLIDTTNVAVQEVYQLYTDYLNSPMDSVYANPYWNTKHWDGNNLVDRSASILLQGYKPKDWLVAYEPYILEIDTINTNRYQIRTVFRIKNAADAYTPYNPPAITKLYAVRASETAPFKLENLLDYDTAHWQRKQVGDILYVVPPGMPFDKKRARKANQFCKELQKRFDIKEAPKVTFHVLTHHNDIMKLFNFEYTISPMYGVTDRETATIFSSYGDPYFPHELVHLYVTGHTSIITEGLATWLSGPSPRISYKEALGTLGAQFKSNRPNSLEVIITKEYHNARNNDPLYVTGAMLCQLAYEKEGMKGVKTLMACTATTLVATLEKLFEMPITELEQHVFDTIISYAKE